MDEGPIFRPRRLAHANIFVGDLDRSMAFYTAIVGLEEVYRRPAVKAGFLSNGNTHHDIGMVEVTSPLCRTKAPGLYHLAFELESELDLVEGYRRAKALWGEELGRHARSAVGMAELPRGIPVEIEGVFEVER